MATCFPFSWASPQAAAASIVVLLQQQQAVLLHQVLSQQHLKPFPLDKKHKQTKDYYDLDANSRALVPFIVIFIVGEVTSS